LAEVARVRGGRAFAIFLAGACGVTACGRTELEGFNVADASAAQAQVTDGGIDARATDTANDGPCRWTFAPQVTYAANGYPVGVAIGDFTGDGAPDILTVNADNGNASVLINSGDGTFARHTTLAVGPMPFDLAVADFSGDGKLDLAIIYEFQASGVSHEVSVFLGRGDGTFVPDQSYPINGGAFAITTGDFNNDGRLDLALIDAMTRLSVLTNRGNGTFGPPATFVAGGGP
jgi:hypothetical protein